MSLERMKELRDELDALVFILESITRSLNEAPYILSEWDLGENVLQWQMKIKSQIKELKKLMKMEEEHQIMMQLQDNLTRAAIEKPKKGMKVSWKFGTGIGTGVIKSMFTERVTMTIDGAEITRNGSEENPALLIEMEDGRQVMKLSSEVMSVAESNKKENSAEYRGREVKLNKPFRTPKGPKKFSVYVKNDKGNVVKVNFGDPNMEIRRDDPERRKNFRARHNCDSPGPKWKARYWSCKMWDSENVSDLV